MAISTLCPGCQELFRLPDELAGKQVRCQKCGRVMMVPSVLSAPAKAPPAKAQPKAPPRVEPAAAAAMPPVPPPVMSPKPAAPPAAPPTPALPTPALPRSDGLPAVVLVEVPVKPVPPPMPEANAPSAPAEPPRRPGPTMTLPRGERGRRTTNRPRRPTSVLAGLSLGGMLLVFVLLIGASFIAWVVTEIQANQGVRQQFNNPVVVQAQPNPVPPVPQPKPPGRNKPNFIEPQPPGFVQQQPGMGPPPLNGAQGMVQVFDPSPAARPGFDDNRAAMRDIKLQNGRFSVAQTLSNNDPRDPVRRWPGGNPALPCKVFLVELQKDKRYVIEYRRQRVLNMVDQFAFDPYLRIESPEGERLVEADDLEQQAPQHDVNARIEFHPTKTATYRIFCTTFQYALRQAAEPFTLSISERPIWVPKANVKVPVPRPHAPVDRLTITPISEKGLQASMLLRPPMRPVGDVCWSADGQSFYVLYNNGPSALLLKCRVNGLIEEKSLDIRAVPGKLAMSAQGLVVSLPNKNELWLIDPDDLHVKERYDVALRQGSDALAASPELDFVYVAGTPQFVNNYPSDYGVAVVNLKLKGKEAVRFYDLPCSSLALSPKGDRLFALRKEVLISYAIDPGTGDVERKATSDLFRRTNDAYRRIDFSADNKYVCVSGVGVPHVVRRANPQFSETAVLALPLDNLRRPAFAIDTDMLVHAVGFDPVEPDSIFSEADDGPLAVYDRNGKRQSVFKLRAVGDDQSPRQLLVHPDGTKVLMRFADRLCFATVANGKGAPVVNKNPNWPQPSAVNDGESFAAATIKRGDVTYRELQLPNLGAIDPCWDADGRSLFHLEDDGTLTRISAPAFVPKDRLALGQPASAMALSAQGLLVALRDQAEVWVINPRSLKVERAITCSRPAKFLAAHPQLSVAAAVGAEVALLDLKEGRVAVRRLEPHPDAKLAFHNPTLSPDGKYLCLAHAGGGDTKVLRVRIAGKQLVIEESRPTAIKGLHAFCVTADSKHVAWYTPNIPAKEPAAFYPVANWQAPAFKVADRARLIVPAGEHGVYLQTTDFDLRYLAQPADKDAKATPVPWLAGRFRIRNLAVQPSQRTAFIASTGTQVYFGERPAK